MAYFFLLKCLSYKLIISFAYTNYCITLDLWIADDNGYCQSISHQIRNSPQSTKVKSSNPKGYTLNEITIKGDIGDHTQPTA